MPAAARESGCAHDDFAAVAADLVRRGVTRPGRIAAEGGSNGGLLIANMLTRYPERFGALFCTIPLIDMRRYSKLLAGASWIAEYGDPDDPQDWAFLGTSRPTTRLSRAGPTRRSCWPRPAATTACIPATPARWPEAEGSGLRRRLLRARGRRTRLWQGQCGDRSLPGARPELPAPLDRLGRGGRLIGPGDPGPRKVRDLWVSSLTLEAGP